MFLTPGGRRANARGQFRPEAPKRLSLSKSHLLDYLAWTETPKSDDMFASAWRVIVAQAIASAN
jgi:hypothetical protein